MLQFNKKFFEEEERNGFCISSMMKRAWAVELEVLSQVSAVCKKYDIPYFAAYGTLLGAIRHKGFIPWDDDVDIALKREDYVRLLKILPKELPESYFVNSYYTCDTHRSAMGLSSEYKVYSSGRRKNPSVLGVPLCMRY